MLRIRTIIFIMILITLWLIPFSVSSQSIIRINRSISIGCSNSPGPGLISRDGKKIFISSSPYLIRLDIQSYPPLIKQWNNISINTHSSINSDGKVFAHAKVGGAPGVGWVDIYIHQINNLDEIDSNLIFPFQPYLDLYIPRLELSGNGKWLFYPRIVCTEPDPDFGCISYEYYLFKYDLAKGLEIDLGKTTSRLKYPFFIISEDGYYLVDRDDDLNIWIRTTDGLPKQFLSQGDIPVISPDGTKIVFECLNNSLCIIKTDGTGLETLINLKPYQIATNLDASKIAFTVFDGHDYELYYYDRNTSQLLKITNNDKNEWEPRMANYGAFIYSSTDICDGYYESFLYLDQGQTNSGNYVNIDMGWGVMMIYPYVFLDGRTRMEVDDQGPELPPDFTPGTPQTYYHLSTTAGFEGEVLVCITYDETAYGGEERVLHLLHSHGIAGDWQDITVILDTEQNQICGLTPDLSDFTIAIGPPWPPYEPPPPSGPSLSSTDDDSSSCGSLPGSQGAGLGAGILLITCLLALRRFRKIWSKK